jgi:quercetin dioxygenase-like cupin family protein
LSQESSDAVPVRFTDTYRSWHRTAAQIRAEGAIGSLKQGIEIEIHGVPTRIIAWPGNGFQTESIHVHTLPPGQEMEMHTYGMAEEAMLCLKGGGEAYVRGNWVPFKPGDLAFFPAGIPHSVRAASSADEDLIVVGATSPPQFDLYEPAGFYNVQYGVVNEEAAFFAHTNTPGGSISSDQQLRYWDHAPDVRPWNLDVPDIATAGALFNIFRGAKVDVIDSPMVFLLWPGYGARSTGFHFSTGVPVLGTAFHAHPAADECVVLWAGTAKAYACGVWHEMEMYDCVFAPCGVKHGISMVPSTTLWGGFAAPPQLDLYRRTEHYKDGVFAAPPYEMLDVPAELLPDGSN